MRKIKYIAIVLLCLVFMAPTTVFAEEAFDITKYDVEIRIDETGRYFIKEDITVRFDYARHGIYRTLPTHYHMNWVREGVQEETDYNWPVENIKVLSDPYEIETYSEGVTIKIGDADKTVEGTKIYRLSYEIQTHDLGFSDHSQMFYFNLIGSEWDTTIDKADLRVIFPKPVDGNQLIVTSGYYGSESSNNVSCRYTENERMVRCTNDQPLKNYESVTLYVPLSDGYFTFPTYEQYIYAGLGVSAVLVALFVVFYFLWGKEEPVITTVEFTAPEGLNSAAVGYIIDNTINNRDITSLIIEWGKDGYLYIEDRDVDLVLRKMRDMGNEKPKYERDLFEALFFKYDEVSTDDLEHTFYTSVNQCKTGIYHYFHAKERRLFTMTSVFLQGLNCLLVGVPMGLIIGMYRFSMTYRWSSVWICLLPSIAIWALISVCFVVLKNQWYNLSAALRIVFLTCLAIAGTLLTALYLTLNIADVPWYYIAMGIAGSVVLLFTAVPMSKRTEYGLKVFGQVLGLKQFIEAAEEDRLKMLAEENPYIFYDILPYAFALGLTKVWQKHFEHLTIPPATFYNDRSGLSTYLMINHLTRSMNTLQSSMVSMPRSSGGQGGGSFGGGGGGFSGGGFGGGGGGSW